MLQGHFKISTILDEMYSSTEDFLWIGRAEAGAWQILIIGMLFDVFRVC